MGRYLKGKEDFQQARTSSYTISITTYNIKIMKLYLILNIGQNICRGDIEQQNKKKPK